MVSPYEVKALKDLPFATGSHCTLKINDDKIMIASGKALSGLMLFQYVKWNMNNLFNATKKVISRKKMERDLLVPFENKLF